MTKPKNSILAITSAAIAALSMGVSVVFGQNTTNPSASESTAGSGSDTSERRALSGRSNMGTLKHGDRSFMERAAKLNAEEVDVSRIVAQSGTDPQVREFAGEMVSAHQAVGSELASIAAQKGVTLPVENANLKKWSDKKPAEIDADYVKLMRSAHKTMVDLFEKGAKSDDPDIAAFANKHLPDLHTHLAKAEALKSATKS